MAAAVIGAAYTEDTSATAGVNGFVETLSGRSGTFLGSIRILAPLGFAFAAGMAASVNPCGFAMLPVYLGLYLGSNQEGEDQANPTRRLSRALLVGAVVTAGFVVLFGIAGVIISAVTRSIVDIIPWLGLTIGALLTVAGAWMIGDGKLYSGFAGRAASRVGDPSEVSVRGYFLFGLSYGIASLSCTLPILIPS